MGFWVTKNQAFRPLPWPPPGAVSRQSLVKVAMVRVDAPHVVQKDVGFPEKIKYEYLVKPTV